MKKTIITIMVTLMVSSAIFGFIIYRIEANHESEISELTVKLENSYDLLYTSYQKLVDDYSELEYEMTELESDVYDVMTGEDYEIDIHKDGVHHTWTSKKVNWWYTNKSHTTVS